MKTNKHYKNNQIRLAYLYPDEMNLYGDYGNVIALKKRCEWHNIDFTVTEIGIGDKLSDSDFDMFFMGGGMDIDQIDVFKDLINNKKDAIKKAVEDNKVFLLICGAYQLFGKYFLTTDGKKIKGLGILDVETKGGTERMIGNISAIANLDGLKTILYGFENHSGATFLGDKCDPLAKVQKGFGNNKSSKTEGAIFKNIFGTYIHGSLLPKNPEFCDYLIKLTLVNKYGRKIELNAIDNTLENKTRDTILSIL